MSRRPILVVEDDEVVRQFLILSLRDDGHEILTADSVGAAREVIFARPDAENLCLIIDVVLRHESGIALAQELLARYPNFHVLLISGFTDEVVLTEKDDGRRIAFLAKPFTRAQLIEALRELCP